MSRLQAPPLRQAGLHLLVLWSFAVVQPLFDLLGRNGEFFAARGSTRWEVVAFALGLALLPPAVLLGLEALVPRPARGAVHVALVGGLVGLIVLEALTQAGGTGWTAVAIAAAAGLGAAVLYSRASAARLVLTVLAPAPLVFLGLFLLHSDASRLTLSSGTQAAAAATNARPSAPTVLVVFDEIPTNSLLDADGRIDPVRFPDFAALAHGSTWFAEHSVVSEGTLQGVPALLTGRFPRPGELPVYHDHPQNLFTLFGRSADLHVAETETHLCPTSLCHGSGDSFPDRLGSLYADASVVYLHELLPADLAHGIPSIANGWQDFWRNGGGASDPARRFRSFVAGIRATHRPALWYLHVLLPHSPWRFLPSGERYSIRPAPGWSGSEVWTGNQAAVDQYWQRHLLQLAFTDRLLGELVARLRKTGLYDRALLVVTGDEGLSFRAGEKRRPASEANLHDISYVPLLVKLPHQRRGHVVHEPSRSTDVLPTIAAALGVRLPWRVDGQNLLTRRRSPERNVVLFKDHGRRFVVPTAELGARRERALRRQLRLFGSDEPPSTLFAVGPDRGLLGHPFEGRRRRVAGLDPLDLSSPVVQVSGRVGSPARSVVAVAAGRVVAVGPVDAGRFWVLVPRMALDGERPNVFAVPPP